MLDNWQRIEQIIKWTGCASVSAFAREIGLLRSENLYQIKRGNNGISRDLSETITGRFPEISRAWLLTGEGAMLRNDPLAITAPIPFFKADATRIAKAGIDPDTGNKPDYYISFPVFDGAAFSALSMCDSMTPDVARGSILFFQPIMPKAIVPGEMYLVVSPHFCGVRFLRRATKPGELRLVPANRKDYDEVILTEGDISQLYSVRGVVCVKGI